MDLERLRDLERLGTLRDRGLLDDDEFAAAKAQLLARPDAPRARPRVPRTGPRWVLPAVLAGGAATIAALVVATSSGVGAERLTVEEYEAATLAAHRTALEEVLQERLGPTEAEAAVVALADELDALEPPEEAEEGHELLVAAYREHVGAIDELVDLVGAASDAATDPSRLDAARTGLALLGSGRAILAARRDLDAAHDRLADEGIDVVTLAHPGELAIELA